MANSRPDLAAINSIDTSQLQSTTARLLVSFAQSQFNVQGMSLNSPMLRSTIVYAEFGQLSEKLSSMSDDASVRTVTKEILEKLKTVTAPAAKAAYDNLSREAEPALKHNEELEQGETLFKQKLVEDRDKTFDALGSLLTAIASANTPDEKVHAEERLETAEKTYTSLNAAFVKLEKARLASNTQLSIISRRGYDALPAKAGITPPPAPTLPRSTI